MDEEPAEVLHLGVEGLRLEAALSSREQSFQLICEHVQLDSCVRTHVGFEVMIAPTPARGPSDGSAPETARPEALYLTLTQDPRWAPVTYLSYLGVAIQPLSLRVEQNTVCRLIRLVDTLNREWQRLEARLQPLQVRLQPLQPLQAKLQPLQPLQARLQPLQPLQARLQPLPVTLLAAR